MSIASVLIRNLESCSSLALGPAVALGETLEALKRERVLAVLESAKGDKERAARLLGVSKRTIYRLIDRYGLDQDADNSSNSFSKQHHSVTPRVSTRVAV